MEKCNPRNEKIRWQYFRFLKEAKGLSEGSIDETAKALNRFEVFTKNQDFRKFHFEQAVLFKNYIATERNQATGNILSRTTIRNTLASLKFFFQWLSWQPGYKSWLQYSDADYFNLSAKDRRVASTCMESKAPTLEQIKHVISVMPEATVIQRRNRALVAFTLLTGARDGAITSFKLKHIDLIEGSAHQDAREVKTKYSKTFKTFFFPVGEEILEIVAEWVTFLRKEMFWGNDDPLFPATHVAGGSECKLKVVGVKRKPWETAAPIRSIFKQAFENAGLPYFNPHSFRNTLVAFGEKVCQTPEQFKAWSQNLGHENVMTTFFSYGQVGTRRQGEIIKNLNKSQLVKLDTANELVTLFSEFIYSNNKL